MAGDIYQTTLHVTLESCDWNEDFQWNEAFLANKHGPQTTRLCFTCAHFHRFKTSQNNLKMELSRITRFVKYSLTQEATQNETADQ